MTNRTLKTAALLAAVLGVCFFWADGAVYRFLHANFNENTRPVPELLKVPHRLLRSAEDWGENVFIIVVLFAMWRMDANHRGRVVCLIAGALLTAAAVEVVKRSAGRLRPDLVNGATVFEGVKRSSDALGEGHSFPSGHTASAGAYSGAIAAFYPPLRPAMVLLACGTGASRVWKERHFLSDCLVGGLMGWAIASALARSRRCQPIWCWIDSKFGPADSKQAADEEAAYSPRFAGGWTFDDAAAAGVLEAQPPASRGLYNRTA